MTEKTISHFYILEKLGDAGKNADLKLDHNVSQLKRKVKNIKCSLTILTIINLLSFNWFSFAQINTENLRRSDLADGFYNTIQSDFAFFSGNSSILTLKGNIRTDFISRNYYTFGVLQYQRGVEEGEKFINKGFVHLRGIYRLTRIFRLELFLQKEFNDFILLKDRNLIGSGLRFAVLVPESKFEESQSINLYFGIGIMWENEKIKTIPQIETKIPRSTNYLSLRWHADDRINLGIVSYYQFSLVNIYDYRILLESKLGFNLTKYLVFQTSLNMRYDNEPPENIEKYDIEINNGFRISF